MPTTPILPLASVRPVDSATEGQRPYVRFRDRVRDRAGAQDLLVVLVGRERFAIPVESVDELVESPNLRKVPGAPENLLGLFTLGDALLPLYSPAAILGAEPTGGQVALVMRSSRARVAIAVDDADDVISVSLSDVLDAPRTGRRDDIVLGVIRSGSDLLTLLDARAVVASYAALSTEGA
jgi:purine-binding chemotaxis protein CheW